MSLFEPNKCNLARDIKYIHLFSTVKQEMFQCMIHNYSIALKLLYMFSCSFLLINLKYQQTQCIPRTVNHHN